MTYRAALPETRDTSSAQARQAHLECGGSGVGAIGMCFTGNFALTMMLEPSVLAPVLSQPSLPLDDPSGLEISPDELGEVRERLVQDDLTVIGYRFAGDRFCTAQRFAAYSEALGDRFIGRVLPDSAANADMPPFFEQVVASPHSVVTAHLIDEEGQPTIAARDEIISFFRNRLSAAGSTSLPGSETLQGSRQARTAIGCGDRPGDELGRSHEGLERGHQPDVRGRPHERTEGCLVRPDREGPVVAAQGPGPQRVANKAVRAGELLANGQYAAEEAHGGGDPLERQVGGHHQVVRTRFHLRASCPGQVRHG